MDSSKSDYQSWLASYRARLKKIVDAATADSIIESFAATKTTSFRVNGIKSTPQAALDALSQAEVQTNPVAWCDEAFTVSPDQRESLSHSSLASEGHIYIQGLSSIFATLVLEPQPDQWNLDLAAAPGGKASHIADLMNNQGKLSVVEPIRKRMYRLADNLNRLGVTIQKTYLMDGRKAGGKVPDRFDCVLLDAPCSGDSRIRADKPDSWKFWSPRKVKEQSRKQKGLIESAFQSTKPGGTLVYCTCSLSPEENELQVDHLLRNQTDADLSPIEVPFSNWQPGLTRWEDAQLDKRLMQCVRILPNQEFDSFFIAKIRKRDD